MRKTLERRDDPNTNFRTAFTEAQINLLTITNSRLKEIIAKGKPTKKPKLLAQIDELSSVSRRARAKHARTAFKGFRARKLTGEEVIDELSRFEKGLEWPTESLRGRREKFPLSRGRTDYPNRGVGVAHFDLVVRRSRSMVNRRLTVLIHEVEEIDDLDSEEGFRLLEEAHSEADLLYSNVAKVLSSTHLEEHELSRYVDQLIDTVKWSPKFGKMDVMRLTPS